MRKRTLKSGRQKKARQSRADPKREHFRDSSRVMQMFTECTLVYHGERARFHYYQCLQLLLRKQIAALITLWDLPSEFEVGFPMSLGSSHCIDFRSCAEIRGCYI